MANRMQGLQLGNYSMGDRRIQGGDFDKVTTMGTLDAFDATFHDLNVMGDANLNECRVDMLQVAGQVEMIKGRIDVASIAGVLKITNVDCGSIHVLGELKSLSSTCRILRYGKSIQLGLFTFASKRRPFLAGDIKGETLENFFPLTLNGNQVFKNIINCGQMNANQEIECTKFFNFASLSAKEINADMVYLYPCASVRVKELHGSLVIIDPMFDEKWLQGIAMDVNVQDITNYAVCRQVQVDCIEADEVVLDYVRCKVVRAKRATIGPHAIIDRIEYEETCVIHPDASVKEKQQI